MRSVDTSFMNYSLHDEEQLQGSTLLQVGTVPETWHCNFWQGPRDMVVELAHGTQFMAFPEQRLQGLRALAQPLAVRYSVGLRLSGR